MTGLAPCYSYSFVKTGRIQPVGKHICKKKLLLLTSPIKILNLSLRNALKQWAKIFFFTVTNSHQLILALKENYIYDTGYTLLELDLGRIGLSQYKNGLYIYAGFDMSCFCGHVSRLAIY